jgi:antirestriction protein
MSTEFDDKDVFDSRNVESRIEDLEMCEPDEDDPDAEAMDPDEEQELAELRAFRDDVDSSEWAYGMTFIAEDYFEDYARELAEDIGAIPDDASWPVTCIDWEQAARELKMDYTSAELNGTTYHYLYG